MIDNLKKIEPLIGRTPIRKLQFPGLDLYVKIEYNNFSGSIKDRAAYYILREAILTGKIERDTTIVESSSGNFAIALASMCAVLGVRFIPVIDPNVSPMYERMLKLFTREVVKVSEPDTAGGYLKMRLKTVKEICRSPNHFWTNQYENVNNYWAYYYGLGQEICDTFRDLDYIFVAVSSGGTITGLSRKLKEHYRNIKVIAVDVEGSVIFNRPPQKRFISGLGSSIVPPILKDAIVEEVINVPQLEIVKGCHDLLHDQQIFGGASTGAVYQAIQSYFETRDLKRSHRPTVLFLCADRGNGYIETIYDKDWVRSLSEKIHDLNRQEQVLAVN